MKVKMCTNFSYRITNKDMDIINLLNTSKNNILRNNYDIDFYNGEWIKVKVNDYLTHIVKPTETLNNIAKKFNLSIEKIKLDNMLDGDKLYIGQILKIYK